MSIGEASRATGRSLALSNVALRAFRSPVSGLATLLASLAAETNATLIAVHLVPPLPGPVEMLATGGTHATRLGPPGKTSSTTASCVRAIVAERDPRKSSKLAEVTPWSEAKNLLSLSILVGEDSSCVVTIATPESLDVRDFYDACSPVGLLTQLVVDGRAIEKLRKDLHDEAQERSLLGASLHHDLRTPLCAILGSARTLRQSWSRLDDADREGLLDSLSAQAERMNRMLNETLQKEASGPGAPVKTLLTDIKELCERAAEVAGISADNEVVVECPPLSIPTDPDKIERALHNLIDNALRYCPPGAAVHVIVEEENTVVTITVADNGPGVSPEVLPGLFGAYATDPGRADGTGLGLHSARRVVEELGGRLGYSRHSDWTRFTITLPLVPTKAPI